MLCFCNGRRLRKWAPDYLTDWTGVVRMQQQQHGGQLGPEQVILVQQPGLGLGQGETIVVTSLGGDRVQTEGVVEIENVEFIGME